MISIRRLYKIGPGPSSSHTMGVKNAVSYIIENYQEIDYVEMTFFGSLAKTGKGHLSDYIADLTFKDLKHKILFDKKTATSHPNTMLFKLYKNGILIDSVYIVSIGGGLIKINGHEEINNINIYPHSTFDEIKKYCHINHLSLVDYILKFEDKDILNYMDLIYHKMMKSIDNGLIKEGTLPGLLKVVRKAHEIYTSKVENETIPMHEKRLISAYAFAVAEENASGQEIVTAPTCGSSGVLPSIVRYYSASYSHEEILKGLLVAGLIGVLVVENGSISGAECGCQAEIGTATSMASAFIAYLEGLDILGIERAAEIAMEHSLGLTCDPIKGYVQIPCIERNAMGALKALSSATLAKFMGTSNSKISFDLVIKTMKETGIDLAKGYKETAKDGLAKLYKE